MRRVGGFHFIEKSEAFSGDMVADRDIIGVGLKAQDLKKQLAPLQMRELGNFFDDLSETHTGKSTRLPERVQAEARNQPCSEELEIIRRANDCCRRYLSG